MGRDPAPRESVVGRRLARSIFLASGLAAALACSVLTAYQLVNFRVDTDAQIDMLTGALTINVADALRFQDVETAELVLSSAAAAPEALLVALYNRDDELFASFSPVDLVPEAKLDRSLLAHEDGQFAGILLTARPILVANKQWGTIVLHWDAGGMWTRLQLTAAIIGVLLVLAYAMSVQMAGRLRAVIGNPLATLAAEAHGLQDRGIDEALKEQDEHEDEIEILRRALESMSLMQLAAGAVDENSREIKQITESLRDASAAMSEDAHAEQRAADECNTSMSRIAESASEVSEAVERLVQRYQDTSEAIQSTDQSIGEITGQMEELVSSIDRVSVGTVESASSAHQIVSAMQGIRDAIAGVRDMAASLMKTVDLVEGRATDTVQLSNQSSLSAEKGVAAVEQTVDAMSQVDDSFAVMSSTVGSLAQRCDEIGQSLVVIESIADETKLLALNAAIIAAQSGEHGRSFAVVAEGIRNLSDRSIASAGEIHTSLVSLQESAANATETVAQGGEKVAHGVACSSEATEVLEEILAATKRAANQVGEICHSTRDQVRDIEHVQEGLNEVGELVEGSNRAALEQERVGQDVADAMGVMNHASRAIGSLLENQKSESSVIATAAQSVNEELEAIRSGTASQADEVRRVHTSLEVFSETTKSATRRADSVHALVEGLVSQAERLRQIVRGTAS